MMDSPFSSSSPLSTPSSRPPRPKVTPLSFLALLPALPAAIVVGVIYHFIARFFDLLILFPIGAGLAAGFVLAGLAKKSKVRSAGALALIGILSGLLCYGAREFSDSLYVREMMISEKSAELAGKDPKLQPAFEGAMRQAFPPLAFFPLYLQASAKQGISITSSHSAGSGGAPIKGNWYWALFALEGVLIIGTTTLAALAQGSAAFCEPCDDWHADEKVVTRLHPNQGEEALKLVQSGDYAGLGSLRGEGADDKMHTDVLLTKCNGCGVGHLKLVTTRDKSVNTLWEGDPTPKEIATLEDVRAQWLK